MRQTLLADCAARSHPLDAYLDPDSDADLPDDYDPDELLADLRDAFDSDAAFRERLSFADHTVESVRERLRAAANDADAAETPRSIPAQFETAEAVVDRAVELDRESVGSLVERHDDSPFVDLLAPLVGAASERLDDGFEHLARTAPVRVEVREDDVVVRDELV